MHDFLILVQCYFVWPAIGLISNPVSWACFGGLFLGSGWKQGIARAFLGMNHAAFKIQLFGRPEVPQIWKREQSHRSGSALVSNGLDCWTSKTSKLRPRSITCEACFNLKETSSVERRLQRKAGFHPEVLESPCFCSCIRVQGWMAHPPPPPAPTLYICNSRNKNAGLCEVVPADKAEEVWMNGGENACGDLRDLMIEVWYHWQLQVTSKYLRLSEILRCCFWICFVVLIRSQWYFYLPKRDAWMVRYPPIFCCFLLPFVVVVIFWTVYVALY